MKNKKNNIIIRIGIGILMIINIFVIIEPMIHQYLWDSDYYSIADKYEIIVKEVSIRTDLDKKDIKFLKPYYEEYEILQHLKYEMKDEYVNLLIKSLQNPSDWDRLTFTIWRKLIKK